MKSDFISIQVYTMEEDINFNDLPSEMIGEIFLRVPRMNMSEVFQVNKQWNKNATFQIVTIKNIKKFCQACYTGDICSLLRVTVKKKWVNEGLIDSTMSNNRTLIKLCISKGANNIEEAFVIACRGGDVDLVKWMLSSYEKDIQLPALQRGFLQCKYGHRKIAELLIKRMQESVDTQ